MRSLLTVALLVSLVAPAWAQAPAELPAETQPSVPNAAETPAAPAPPEEGDEEAAAPAPAAEAPPPPTVPADAPLETRPLTVEEQAARAKQQKLVSGAPLYNPNVAVHIVQKKRFRDEGKHELVLFPAAVQVNGKFSQHAGTALQYVYHLQENFALQLTPQYNWYANESGFNKEIINKVREQAPAATALLLAWSGLAGVEVTPLYGKFAFYNDLLAQFGVVLSGGAGIGSTRNLLRPEAPATLPDGSTLVAPDRFGDTGMKFVGSVGGGFRVQVGDRFALRLEVRDVVYTARADRVNGCNLADLNELERTKAEEQPFATAQLSGSCREETFRGVQSGQDRRDDIVLARDLVAQPSSDVLNVVSFYTGLSFLF